MAYKDLQEFTGEEGSILNPIIQDLPTHTITDSDWCYFKIFSGGEVVFTKFVFIRNNENINYSITCVVPQTITSGNITVTGGVTLSGLSTNGISAGTNELFITSSDYISGSAGSVAKNIVMIGG